MRILHVVRGLANSSGTTHVVVPLSEAQARLGCEVTVFHVRKKGEVTIEPARVLVSSECFPLTISCSQKGGISLRFAEAIRRQVNSFDVVHIHAVWNFPTAVAMWGARWGNVPFVVAPQGSFDPWAMKSGSHFKRSYGALVEFPLLQRAAFLQALTYKEVEDFQRLGIRAPTAVIPNGVDEQCFSRQSLPLRETLDLPDDYKVLLYLSRLAPKKGLKVLAEAFEILLERDPRIALVIAGHDGGTGYEPEVRKMMDRKTIRDNCIFVGELVGRKKFDALLGADVFVLPSYSEGLPIAVIEAMAAGLPVVCTKQCNLPEIEDWCAGHVVETDSHQIAEALSQIISNPIHAEEMGRRGRKLVNAKFTWPIIARQTIDLYEKACASNGRTAPLVSCVIG